VELAALVLPTAGGAAAKRLARATLLVPATNSRRIARGGRAAARLVGGRVDAEGGVVDLPAAVRTLAWAPAPATDGRSRGWHRRSAARTAREALLAVGTGRTPRVLAAGARRVAASVRVLPGLPAPEVEVRAAGAVLVSRRQQP